MNYRKIMDFKPSSMINALEDIYAIYLRNIEIAKEIQDTIDLIPSQINIGNPNITSLIGGDFDKIKKEIVDSNSILLKDSNAKINITAYNESDSLGDNSVMFSSNILANDRTLRLKLLKKGDSSYDVSWYYDRDLIETSDSDKTDLVPSFTECSRKRFMKVSDNIPILSVISGASISDSSIVTVGLSDNKLNRKDALSIYCNPLSVVGESFTFDSNIAYLSGEEVNIEAKDVADSEIGTIFNKTPLTSDIGELRLMRSDLSNAKTVSIANIDDSNPYSVINNDFLTNHLVDFIDNDQTTLPFETETKGDTDNAVASVSDFIEIARQKSSEMYSTLLKRAITGEDDSILGEVNSSILTKIEDIASSYVSKDECSDTPLNNKDESCKINCKDHSAVEDKHLMITKQRAKSMILCSMKC